MKVLIVEDEKKVASFIRKGLASEGFAVEMATDGAEGLAKLSDSTYDIIILDLMLPKLDGLSILRHLRQVEITTPVLVLTAKGKLEDRIEGLNLGADDYLVKPFAFGELLARIRAILRRNQPHKDPVMKFEDLVINPITRQVLRGGTQIDMSPKEYALLEFMAFNADRALNRSTLSEHVWNYSFDRGTNFIDVYINRLRNKIDEGHDRKFIRTVRGYGYMFKT